MDKEPRAETIHITKLFTLFSEDRTWSGFVPNAADKFAKLASISRELENAFLPSNEKVSLGQAHLETIDAIALEVFVCTMKLALPEKFSEDQTQEHSPTVSRS